MSAVASQCLALLGRASLIKIYTRESRLLYYITFSIEYRYNIADVTKCRSEGHSLGSQ